MCTYKSSEIAMRRFQKIRGTASDVYNPAPEDCLNMCINDPVCTGWGYRPFFRARKVGPFAFPDIPANCWLVVPNSPVATGGLYMLVVPLGPKQRHDLARKCTVSKSQLVYSEAGKRVCWTSLRSDQNLRGPRARGVVGRGRGGRRPPLFFAWGTRPPLPHFLD